MGLLGHMVKARLTLKESIKLFSRVFIPFCIPVIMHTGSRHSASMSAPVIGVLGI